MATTQEKSTEVTNQEASPPTKLSTQQMHGRVRIATFEFTQGAAAGDTLSTVDLVKLPPKSMVLKTLSEVVVSAFGAARTLDIGFAAYTNQAGTMVAADADIIADGLDVSSAAVLGLGAGTAAILANLIKLDNREPLTIQALVTGTGTIPAAATIKGYIAYVVD